MFMKITLNAVKMKSIPVNTPSGENIIWMIKNFWNRLYGNAGRLKTRDDFHWRPSNLALNHVLYISLGAFVVLLICILTVHYFVRKARRKKLGLPSTRKRKRGSGNPGSQLLSSGAASLRAQIATMRGRDSRGVRNSLGGSLVQKDSLQEAGLSLERATSNRTLDKQSIGMREKGASFDRTRAWQTRNPSISGRSLNIPMPIRPPGVGSNLGNASGKEMTELAIPSPAYASGARAPPSPTRKSLQSIRTSGTRQSINYPDLPSPTSIRHQTPPHSPSLRHLALIEANIPARNFSPKFFPPSSPPPPIPKDPQYIPRTRSRSLSNPQADRPKVYAPEGAGHRPSLSISKMNGRSVSSLVLPIFNFSSKDGEESETGSRPHTPPIINEKSSKRFTKSSGTSSVIGGDSNVNLSESSYWVTPSTPAGSEVTFSAGQEAGRPALITTSGWDTSSEDEAEGKKKRKSRINIKDLKGKRKS
ncbi:hypothetical protein DFH27DRAFT_117457 [Peziza echinospora]|nr:hypothetical protein DFH27DRAFT_117457 [Peziza echinospora]